MKPRVIRAFLVSFTTTVLLLLSISIRDARSQADQGSGNTAGPGVADRSGRSSAAPSGGRATRTEGLNMGGGGAGSGAMPQAQQGSSGGSCG